MFVNTNGHVDGHITADQRMEYLVKEEHIEHMFSNKTENNIMCYSLAARHSCELRHGEYWHCKNAENKDKSSAGDEIILLKDLRRLRPFKDKTCVHSKVGTIMPSGVERFEIYSITITG